MDRWVEHYLELNATENVVTDAALSSILDLSVMEELDIEPTIEESLLDGENCAQDMQDANIITLHKNNGERSNCNNYRGISLLCIVGKVFTRVALTKSQTLASCIYPESQCGFRAGRSTVDMITLHSLHRPNKGFRPRQPIPPSSTDRCTYDKSKLRQYS